VASSPVTAMGGEAATAAAMSASSRSVVERIRSPDAKKSWFRRSTRVALSRSMEHVRLASSAQ